MKDFLFPSQYHGQKQAQKRKGYRYLAHKPGDGGHDPSREIGHSNWVFSYADMMTSMVVFLILLLSFSKVNYEKLAQLSEETSDKKITTEQKPETATTAMTATTELQEVKDVKTPIEKLENQMAQMENVEGLKFVREGSGASLIIEDSILFNSGHAQLTSQALTKINPVFQALQALPPDYVFIIEGHTDDNPINTFEYASNWELSAARALAVLLALGDAGIEPSRLSFHAFGQFNPVKPNRNVDGKIIPENQSFNRRAIIKIRQGLDE